MKEESLPYIQSAHFVQSLKDKFETTGEETIKLERCVKGVMERIKNETESKEQLEIIFKNLEIERIRCEIAEIKSQIKINEISSELNIKERKALIARENINTLLNFFEKNAIETDIIKEIDSNIKCMRIEAEEPEKIELTMSGSSITCNDLRKTLAKTNVMEVIRNAKKNGWEMRISDDIISLYDKEGKRILDLEDQEVNKDFVKNDYPTTTVLK